MYRPHMRGIPRHDLPAGFVFRPYGDGDAETWVRIQAAANVPLLDVTMKTYVDDFAGHEHELPGRSWFVVSPSGREVGSITAWWRETPAGRQGLIHWVAVVPECQAKGIGKAMMTKAMDRLREEYGEAYLNTSSARIPAIKLYLDFGFLPDMRPGSADEGWAEVRRMLKHPGLGNA